MKSGLHPASKEINIVCSCGAEYKTLSTKEDMRVEICSACHPFYTGKQRATIKGGRVERFNKKYGKRD